MATPFMIGSRAAVAPMFRKPRASWGQNGEPALNWLAVGLLLAAWNAASDEGPAPARTRPDALRGYSAVSVRAAHRSGVEGF